MPACRRGTTDLKQMHDSVSRRQHLKKCALGINGGYFFVAGVRKRYALNVMGKNPLFTLHSRTFIPIVTLISITNIHAHIYTYIRICSHTYIYIYIHSYIL